MTNTSIELEAIQAVEKELDRVINKFTEVRESTLTEIGDVANVLEELIRVLVKTSQEATGSTMSTATQVGSSSGTSTADNEDEPMADAETEMQVEIEREYSINFCHY